MNRIESNFLRCYAAQSRTLGYDVVATIGTACVNAKAILGTVNDDDTIVEGGIGQRGGFLLQILASEFASTPAHDDSVTCNGAAANQKLVVTSFDLPGSVYRIQVGDPQF